MLVSIHFAKTVFQLICDRSDYKRAIWFQSGRSRNLTLNLRRHPLLCCYVCVFRQLEPTGLIDHNMLSRHFKTHALRSTSVQLNMFSWKGKISDVYGPWNLVELHFLATEYKRSL